MEDFYPQIRTVHIAAVIASGLLFAFRGAALNLFSAPWTRALPLRVLSWCIDTVLLTAALMLMTIVDQAPIADAWLTVKVLCLVLYIGLGTVALKPGRPIAVRRLAFTLSLVVFAFIVSVARTHDPAGVFSTI